MPNNYYAALYYDKHKHKHEHKHKHKHKRDLRRDLHRDLDCNPHHDRSNRNVGTAKRRPFNAQQHGRR